MNNLLDEEIDKKYTILVSEVIEYIEQVKNTENNLSLIDIISDYCFKRGIEPEMMGDAIKNDVYFTSFISKDCEVYNTVKKNLNDW